MIEYSIVLLLISIGLFCVAIYLFYKSQELSDNLQMYSDHNHQLMDLLRATFQQSALLTDFRTRIKNLETKVEHPIVFKPVKKKGKKK